MFSQSYQSGFLSLFYSEGEHPLEIWQTVAPSLTTAVITPQTQEDNTVNNVEIKFMEDDKIFGRILQLYSTNSRQVFIACPAMALDQSLGIRLPYGILLVKNMNKYFSLELGIRDHRRILRRFRLANYQKEASVADDLCVLPLQLDNGWNQLRIDMPHLVQRAYGGTFNECVYLRVHANCRLRRIYFTNQLLAEDQLPPEFKLYWKEDPDN